MKKSTLISILALATAAVGVLIALAAYFNKKREALCDDFDSDFMCEEPDDVEYYAAHISDDIPEDCSLEEEIPCDSCLQAEETVVEESEEETSK